MIKVLCIGRAVVLSLLWNVCVNAAASENAPVDEFAKKMEAATKALASTQAVIGDKPKQVDAEDQAGVVDSEEKSETVDGEEKSEAADSAEKSETVNVEEKSETADAEEKVEVVDSAEKSETVNVEEKSETTDTAGKSETVAAVTAVSEIKAEKQVVKSALTDTAAKLDELNKTLSNTMASASVSTEEVPAPSKVASVVGYDASRLAVVESDVAALQKQIVALAARVDLLEVAKKSSAEAETLAKSHWSFSVMKQSFSRVGSLLHQWIVEPVHHLLARIGSKKN